MKEGAREKSALALLRILARDQEVQQNEKMKLQRFPMKGGPDLVLGAFPFSEELDSTDSLHPNEITKLQEISNAKRRSEWIAGRLLLKQALMEAWGESRQFSEIEIASGFNRQPWIASPSPFATSVSLTHSNGWAFAAVTPASHPVGIDVEVISEGRLEAMKRDTVLCEVGLEDESALERQALRLTVAWTAKEALSKIFGCGLGVSFKALALRDFQAFENEFEGGYGQVFSYRWMSVRVGKKVLSLALPSEHFVLRSDFQKWLSFLT